MPPASIRTPRLLLRRWQPEDADALQPILDANVAHLTPWIPAHVAEPGALAEIVKRLERYAAAFDGDREWRYAVLALDETRLLGEVSVFPRRAAGRVPFANADRVEIGYWIRTDATGCGFATEAARAALDAALSLPGISLVEIRCDERNAASGAIPRRLGFHLRHTIAEVGVRGDAIRLQVWEFSSTNPNGGQRSF